MKYQIYLNKETSDFINKASEQTKTKPATFIKKTLEGIFTASMRAYEEMEKNFDLRGLENGLKKETNTTK